MADISNRENLRATSAELIATFLFVFIGVGSIGAYAEVGVIAGPELLLIGLAHGLGIAIGIMAIGRVSGAHINPAVTFAAVIAGRIGITKATMYVAAQLAGASLAVLALDAVAYDSPDLGVQSLASTVSTGNGFVIEVILSFFLVFVIFATAMEKRGNAVLAPLAIGGTVALCHFAALPLTGASMNPARSFGPALIHGSWNHHWIYWAAPLVGALIAATAYIVIFGTPEDRRRAGTISLKEEDLAE